MKFITIFDPKKEINFIGNSGKASVIAFCLSTFSLIGLFVFGINWGIDFSGGMELQVKFQKEVSSHDIRSALSSIGFDKNQVQQFGPTENNEMLIRVEKVNMMGPNEIENYKKILDEKFPSKTADSNHPRLIFDEKSGNQAFVWLDQPQIPEGSTILLKEALENQRKDLLNLLFEKGSIELRKTKESAESEASINNAVIGDSPADGQVRYTIFFGGISNKINKELEKRFGSAEIRRVDFVDSNISKQLRTDGLLALLYALIAIVIYVAIRFDIFFSPGAIVALIHDVMVAMLVFVVGRAEFDTPSIAALLTILGYSINNTVVIYDRIRATVPEYGKKSMNYRELKPYVNKAINDTLSRTINSTLTTLFASISVWIFASGVIASFAKVLTVGISFGVFTSIFISPSLYLLAKKYFHKDDENQFSHEGPTREEKAKGVV